MLQFMDINNIKDYYIYILYIMSKWYEIFDGVFFITIITICGGSFAIALKYCLKSKCENFKCCWGLVEIERNVEIEVEEELKEMEMGNNIRTNHDNNLII